MKGKTFSIIGSSRGIGNSIGLRLASENTGNFYIDEDVLRAAGVRNLEAYQEDLTQNLIPDFFL